MDALKLHRIVQDATGVFRTGNVVEERQVGDTGVVELFGYAPTSEAPSGDNFDKVDMVLVDVVVNKAKAEQYRGDLAEQMRDYPQQERLAMGPSYIELAPNLGIEQEDTLRLMALGKTLGMWDIISAKTHGIDGEVAKELARNGFLMIYGYDPSK